MQISQQDLKMIFDAFKYAQRASRWERAAGFMATMALVCFIFGFMSLFVAYYGVGLGLGGLMLLFLVLAWWSLRHYMIYSGRVDDLWNYLGHVEGGVEA